MNDDQVDRLLAELVNTRESFDNTIGTFKDAIKSIKWNRINTIIQYCLIVVVFLLGGMGVWVFVDYRQQACERTNTTRTVVSQGMEVNAFAIGAALAAVLGGDQEDLNRYLDAYHEQRPSDSIELVEC